MRIVILTVSGGERSLFESLRCGASGYLPKKVDPQVLYGTLRAVVQGEAPVSQVMAARLLQGFARRALEPAPAAAHAAELTAPEKEVLEHGARGSSREEAATALAIIESTVKDHLRHILEHQASRATDASRPSRTPRKGYSRIAPLFPRTPPSEGWSSAGRRE